jgi:hypothetical protein
VKNTVAAFVAGFLACVVLSSWGWTKTPGNNSLSAEPNDWVVVGVPHGPALSPYWDTILLNQRNATAYLFVPPDATGRQRWRRLSMPAAANSEAGPWRLFPAQKTSAAGTYYDTFLVGQNSGATYLWEGEGTDEDHPWQKVAISGN